MTDGQTRGAPQEEYGPAEVICPYCGEEVTIESGPTRFAEVTHCNDRWIVVDLEEEKTGRTGRYATDGSREGQQPATPQEMQVRCQCGFQTGWFDREDAEHIAAHHAAECGGPVEYKEREKNGTNYSDGRRFEVGAVDYLKVICPECEDPRDYECLFCGRRFAMRGPRNKHEEVCLGP